MHEFFIALRAVHYASAMLLFGELVFMLGVAGPVFRRARTDGIRDGLDQRLLTVARWSLVASFASGAAWFAVETVVMSGLPVEQAMTRGTLGLMLADTVFGRVFAVRFGLVVALGAVLMAMGRSNDGARRFRLAMVALALAAAYLGSLAWAGHAVAGDESEGLARIVAAVAHLLAAGAWLGALPALLFALDRARAQAVTAHMARRFSTLGLISVGVLTASGLANTWYQVGGFPALVGTDYGRLLIVKLGLFATMLAFAAINRGISTRPAQDEDPKALRLLRRNVALEIALGIGVIAVVGALGVTVPATHQSPVWPFDRTLSFESLQPSAWRQFVVSATGAAACIAAVALVAGALGRPPRIRITAVAGILMAGAILAFLLEGPAHPTTYAASPVRYTTDAMATGAALYAAKCSGCHGRDGRGESSAPPSLASTAFDLNERVRNRREGDLFWSIAHGVPGTPMRGFAPQMSDMEIWSLIQFLDGQTAAEHALAMSDRIRPLRSVPAPDFTYELIGRPQESLWQERGNRVTLLVFYTLPSSLPRLLELAALERTYTAASARVIALPMPASPAATTPDLRGEGDWMLAFAGSAVAATYMMFAREAPGAEGDAPTHVEYLIDRFGFLRVRWIGPPDAAAGRSSDTLREIATLVNEPSPGSVQWGHRH